MEKLSGIQKKCQISNYLRINITEKENIYPTKIDDWKKFEKNTATISLNFLYTKEK